MKNPKYRIMVVDDKPDVKLGLEMALEESGLKVYAYDDPVIALENFIKRAKAIQEVTLDTIMPIDLVILNFKMPKMNGIELFKEIRRIDEKVKICFLTANVNVEYVLNKFYKSLNPGQVILKPVEYKDLIMLLNAVLENTENNKRL